MRRHLAEEGSTSRLMQLRSRSEPDTEPPPLWEPSNQHARALWTRPRHRRNLPLGFTNKQGGRVPPEAP